MGTLPFTLQQLQVFLAVARTRSFTAAGKALHLSQPAVSLAIDELERRLEIPLFERVRRQLALTPEGERLLARAAEMIEIAEEAVEAISGAPGGGTLRIGASTTVGNYILPAPLVAFHQRFPDTRIALSVDNTKHILDLLLAQDLLVALIEGPCHHPDVEVERFCMDELVVVCPPDHRWAGHPEVPWAEAERERFILREEGSGTRDVIVQVLERHGRRLESPLTLGHTEAIKTAVELGLGVSILSRVACERELAAGALAETRIAGVVFDRWLYQVTLRGRRSSPLVRAFLGQLREAVPGTRPDSAAGLTAAGATQGRTKSSRLTAQPVED